MYLRKKFLLTALIGAAWTAVVALGFRMLLKYETRPGRIGSVGVNSPAGSGIPRSAGVEGTGLGLALCQRLMHAMGGEIGVVEETMGEGKAALECAVA